jgi:hypothetical protein
MKKVKKCCEHCEYWNTKVTSFVSTMDGWGLCPKHKTYTQSDDMCGLFELDGEVNVSSDRRD